MVEIPPLTPQILEQLRDELGGCDFSGEHERRFLSTGESCDVQAVPGNGKTTLLVAKLALLSRSWTSRTQGVCVMSHTNAARDEVEKKLSAHPSASAFLDYPHFIGTVTAFMDRFLALPYLRGLGWPMHRIDDDVFAAIARSRWRGKPALRQFSYGNGGRNTHAVERWVEGMELADDFECERGADPARLKIRNKIQRQPGPHTNSGRELEELKAEIVKDGFYRFADMTALANQAVATCPALVERIRKRFPLVLLDEAQDTNGAQLALLDRLFGDGTAYQRLGDQNQTLYENDELGPGDYWSAREGAIPLNVTRRFGHEIAAFASRLTVRAAQQIEGVPGTASRRTLLLFDRESIGHVLPAYAEEVRAHWPVLSPNLDIRAVASRHNPAGDTRGNWPKTLIEYYPDYRSGRGGQTRPDTLCSSLRQAAILHETQSSPAEIAELITAGISTLLRHQDVQDDARLPVSKRNVWSVLSARDPALPLRLKRLIRDNVIAGHAAWDAAGWGAFRGELVALLGIGQDLEPQAGRFLEFVEHGAAAPGAQEPRTVFAHDGVSVRLGSIHSVKGKTVDGVLIVETEVWRPDGRAMDLQTVLPHAFGLENRDFNANTAQLAAATNIFVAATRPRQLLSCAMRKDAASEDLIAAAGDQAWVIRDLTA